MNNPLLYILRRVMSYPLFRRGIGGGFFLFFILSCGDGERASYLRQAEAQLPEHPDSAQTLLNRVGNPYELSDDNRAYYGLLRTWADDLITFEVKSDTLLRDTYLYYNKVSEGGETSDSVLLRRYAQSCYLMGRYYVSADSTKQAEDLLRRATVLADRAHDYRTTYLAYHYLSKQLVWSNQQEALNLSLKALEYCQRCMDKPSNEIAVRFNVATNYALLGDTANAFKMTDTAYHITVQNNLKMQEHEALRTYGSIYFMIEDYPKALEFTKKSFEDNLQMNEYHVIFQLASCYLYCDSLEKAKKTLLSLLSIKDVSVKSSVYWELYDIAFKQGNYSDVRIYADSTFALNEKNLFDALELKDAYYKDVIQQEKQAEQLKYESSKKTALIIILCLLTLLIVIALFVYHRWKVVLEKQKRLAALHRQKHEWEYNKQKEKEKNMLLDAQQKEIQYKNEIIHQKSVTLSVFQKHLLDKIESIHPDELDRQKDCLSQATWNEMEALLNDTDNLFVKNLRQNYPDFTESDFQLCMLVRLKIQNSAIASIYNIGISAVKKRKSNLKKDGFKVVNPDLTLEDIVERL